MKPTPDEAVVDWLNRQPAASLWTTSITVFEIEHGLQQLKRKHPGRRVTFLEVKFGEMLNEELSGRILSFDTQAALFAGAVADELDAKGKTGEIRDVQIAGIARMRQATVATGNLKHFKLTCDVVNPWENARLT